ncbi:MAG: PPC domain-containing protein [Gemmatimonadaceae bacterium]|jgi:hypothetical protein|nr:PPC domain-containing protein [Gemmatimonadaceae bacterium]
MSLSARLSASSSRLLVPALLLATVAGAAGAQTAELPLGKSQPGRVTAEDGATYRVTVPAAGVLSVAVEGAGDLRLRVLDADGQPLPDGMADADLDGKMGRETVSVRVTEAGAYQVRVESLDDEAGAFEVGASFLAFPSFAKSADTDGRPSQARAAEIGKAIDDALDANAGDLRDWYVLTASQDGTLALATRKIGSDEELDLVLEVFAAGSYVEPVQQSDNDLEEDTSREGVTVAVRAGQKVYVRVRLQSGGAGRYRLSSSLMP